MSQRSRDRYAEVGGAMRDAILRAIAAGGINRRSRVLLSVLWLTASYSKITDRCYVAQIAEVAQIADDDKFRNTRRELKALHDDGVIAYHGRQGVGGGSWVTLRPEAFDRPLMLSHDGEGKPVRSDRLGGDKPVSSDPPNGSVLTLQTGQIRPDTEKFFREVLPSGFAGRRQLQKLDEPVRCIVCDRDVGEAAYVGGQWWCADHVERAA